MVTTQEMIDIVVTGKDEEIKSLTIKALDEGMSADDILNDALIPAMGIVGDKYEKGEYYLPQMLLSANTFYASFDVIQPMISGNGSASKGTIVVGVVEGDIHDIGKNIVKTMLQANGFNMIDLTKDVAIEDWVDTVRDKKPDMIGMTTLMTPTMRNMRRVIEDLEDEGLRSGVKVILGGGPVSKKFADKIGADGYGDNENEAVDLVKSLLGCD